MLPDYAHECNCGKRQKKTITIYKSRKAAEDFISGMDIPVGAMDVVYYRDNSRELKCLIVVGNMPHTLPFIFDNDAYTTNSDGSSSGSGSGSGSSADSDSSNSGTDEMTWDGDFDSSTTSWDIIVTPDNDESEHV